MINDLEGRKGGVLLVIGGFVASYWGIYYQFLKGMLSVIGGCIVSPKEYVYRRSLNINILFNLYYIIILDYNFIILFL